MASVIGLALWSVLVLFALAAGAGSAWIGP